MKVPKNNIKYQNSVFRDAARFSNPGGQAVMQWE